MVRFRLHSNWAIVRLRVRYDCNWKHFKSVTYRSPDSSFADVSPCACARHRFKEEHMIRAVFTGLAAIIAFSWTSSFQGAFGQEESDQRLGTVHFPTSCNEI